MKGLVWIALTLLAVPHSVLAQEAAIVRETAELLLKQFGKEAAGETIETLTSKVAQISARFGDDGVVAIRKVGPRAFEVIARAGEENAGVVKLMAKRGDEAVWVVSEPKKLAIFIKYGDESAQAMMAHKGVAAPLIEKTGAPGIKALNAINTPNARRLANLVDDGVIVRGQSSERLLEVISEYGDRAAQFIWKNKGPLMVGTVLVAFLADPEPFINGARDLPNAIAGGIISRTNWTVVLIAGMFGIGAYLWLSGKRRQRSTTTSGNQQ